MWKIVFKFENKEQLESLLSEVDYGDVYSIEGFDVIFEQDSRFMAEGLLGYYSDILSFKEVDFDYSLEGKEEDLEPVSYWKEYGLTDKDFL